MKNWQKWLGIAACIGIIVSCFMPWAFYPDVAKHFTGFDSLVSRNDKMVHYYGRWGFLLCSFAAISLVFHLLQKNFAKRANLVVAALCLAVAIAMYFRFTSAYVGYVPVKEIGIFLLVICSVANLIAIIFFRLPPANNRKIPTV